MAVNTKTVAEFRRLRFDSAAALRAEVERCIAADRSGALRCSGNWTLGQVLGHLATWVDFLYNGFPPTLKAPWIVRFIVGRKKTGYLSKGLPRGVRIPSIKDGTLGAEPRSIDEGVTRFRSAWDRLEGGAPLHPSPVFGQLSQHEAILLNLRHAELHLGYMHPPNAP